ncbi:hypothetical protein [Euzebya tangerina]|uniref:hypothetical protein n=1 Tax=Euzebya tangerina TaxID=591198 RepID=UPI000E31835C|nr:hypothetical protein [Euzebya tangerina]
MDIGTWVRAGTFVGRVGAVEDDGTLVLFDPGDRQLLRATPGAVTALPTGPVEVTVTTTVDLPHGLTETAVKRWVAAQLDPVLAERATESVTEAGLAGSIVQLDLDVAVREASG